jgi:hypothetical protein
MGGGFLGGSSGSGSSTGGGFLTGSSSGTTGGSFLPTSSSGSFLNLGTTMANTSRSSNTNYNAFSGYFANPMAVGWPGSTGSQVGTFGTPLVGTLSTSTTGTATFSRGGTATFTQTTTGIYSMIGQRRSPTYVATLGFPFRQPTPSQIEPELQSIIARAQSLPSRGTIRVSTDGQAVVLRGTVSDDHERRLAESILRLTPGVREVRNDLTVRSSPSASGAIE